MQIQQLNTDLNNFEAFNDGQLTVYRCVRIMNSDIGLNTTFGDYAYCKDSIIGNNVLLNRNSFITNSIIDDFTQIGFNTKILYSTIGKFCSISWDCSIGGSNHNLKAATTFNLKPESTHYHEANCILNNDVWCGSGVTILRGITIGNGAVIGAGAVVTNNVEDYEIVAGVPARHIGWRFNESFRKSLSQSKWWNLPIDVIQDNISLFSDDLNADKLRAINSLCIRCAERSY